MNGTVLAVGRDEAHRFSKSAADEIRLVAGLGVDGDAHHGATVRHRSRVAVDPTQPNLRQVHLLHAEVLAEVGRRGFTVAPLDLGENITTRGLDLLCLPTGTRLAIGAVAVLEVTGLRDPCAQIERFQTGLLAALLDRTPDGAIVRKAGIMSVVVTGGPVRPGDAITVTLPPQPFRPLERV